MPIELVLGAVPIFVVDQASKILALAHLHEKPARAPLAGPRLNPGPLHLVPSVPALIAVWLLALLALSLPGTPLDSVTTGARAAAGVALGAAASNLLDLLARGGVVDFIDVRVWPLFNLADVALVMGVAGVVLLA